jgi:hypothetical protein
MPEGYRPVTRDRETVLDDALAIVDHHLEREDYGQAFAWLDVIEVVAGELPPAYLAKRRDVAVRAGPVPQPAGRR